MKLRALALLLVLANLVFFVWSQGALDAIVGMRSAGDREPERLTRQFQPQALRLVPPGEVAAAMSVSCLEAGPFTQAEAGEVKAALTPTLAGSARVVPPSDAASAYAVRVERVDAALAAQVAALTGEVKGQPLAKAFAPCAK